MGDVSFHPEKIEMDFAGSGGEITRACKKNGAIWPHVTAGYGGCRRGTRARQNEATRVDAEGRATTRQKTTRERQATRESERHIG